MKRKFPLIVSTLLASFILGACETLPNEDTSKVYDNYYLVSFYVEDNLYKTARVKENEVVGEIIESPKKDGYTFNGWILEDGSEFSLTETLVTSSLSLYADFSKKETSGEELDLNVNDIKDPTKEYYLVVGWYGKTSTSGLDEETVKHFYKNVITYLSLNGATNDDLENISFRRYGDDDTDVATMGSLINDDGDVDILIGVGGNVDSTGGVSIIEKTSDIMMGGKSRYVARLTDKEIVNSLYSFVITETGQKMFDTSFTLTENDLKDDSDVPTEPTFNVEDVKDPNKTYSLVIGWYGKTSTSGLDVENVTHFYKNVYLYLEYNGYTSDELSSISFRRYGDDDTDVATMGSLVNDDGDVDILIGVGGNVDSTGGVSIIEKTSDIMMGGKSRYIARLTDKEIVTTLYSYLITEDGQKLFDLSYNYEK